MLIQKGARENIDPVWILLYNHSTEDAFSNPRLVQNILHYVEQYIMIQYNSGKRRVIKEATLKGYGTSWFDKGTIPNILSFTRITENHPFCYETKGN